jgi:hypothetical protein
MGWGEGLIPDYDGKRIYFVNLGPTPYEEDGLFFRNRALKVFHFYLLQIP